MWKIIPILIAFLLTPFALITLNILDRIKPETLSNFVYYAFIPFVAIGFLVIFFKHSSGRSASFRQKAASAQDVASVRQLFRTHAGWLDTQETFLEHGPIKRFTGETFLILDFSGCPKRPHLNINPIDVLFEPVQLNEALEQHLVIASRSVKPGSNQAGRDTTGIRLRSRRRTYIYTIALTALVSSFMILLGLSRLNSPLSCMAWFVPAWALLFIALRFRILPENPFLIPAGLFFRSPSRNRQNSVLQRMSRRECITIISGSSINRTFTALIMNTQTREQVEIKIPLYQLEIFLSAWLSPLPTPSLEEMSDFT